MCGLFETYETDDECDRVDVFVWQFKGVIVGVVRDNKDVLLVRSRFYSFDERSLRSVEDVGLIPLEE